MLRLIATLAILAVLLASCQSAEPTEAPPEPLALVTSAAENIRETETFRMLVEVSGAPYYIATDLGNVEFRRAQAQYVAPSEMQATVRLIAAALPTEVDVFSRAENQWYRNDILTGGRWYNAPFSPGFNPETLIAQETGFQRSLQALIDMKYSGTTELESGERVHHVAATANGADVTALLAGLVEMGGTVNVDVYVNTETLLPARFVITQPDTVTETEPEPTVWTIDIYDFNAPPEIEDPDAGDQIVPVTEETTPLIIESGVTSAADNPPATEEAGG